MPAHRNWFVDIFVGAWSMVKGLSVTGLNLFRPRTTENYPAVRVAPSPRLRGKMVHLRGEDGRLKCTACLACQKACPGLAIPTVEGDDKKGRERRAKTYIWDAGRCLFCGYCVEVCPFHAIRLSQEHSVVGETREELFRNLAQLLEPAPRRVAPATPAPPEPVAAPAARDAVGAAESIGAAKEGQE